MLNRREIGLGLAATAFAGDSKASTPDWRLANKAASASLWKDGRYHPMLNFIREVDDPTGIGLARQWAALVGEEAYAMAQENGMTSPVPDLSGAAAEDAVAAVVRAAAGRRVVMLNESHSASRHRLFLAKLIRALRAEGFNHLAAETFTNRLDTDAPKVTDLSAGDQFGFGHGTYSADPVFAEAVREALGLGYRLVAYEQRRDQQATTPESSARIAAREQAQAENLATALAAAPEARFLVHVGLAHLLEKPDGRGNTWFAERLKAMTGIDPLTVTQASTGAFGPHAPDPPLATAVLARFKPIAPIIVTLPDGKSLGAAAWSADLAVFHPRLSDIDGRPGWLAADPLRRRLRHPAPAERADGQLLAQALHAREADPAIPADQYVLPGGATSLVFHLRPGRYRLRLESAAGFTPLGEVNV